MKLVFVRTKLNTNNNTAKFIFSQFWNSTFFDISEFPKEWEFCLRLTVFNT